MANVQQPNSVASLIWKRIEEQGRGWVFTPREFIDLGSRQAVDTGLCRLRKAGSIRRLRQGLYDFPVKSRLVGEAAPSADAVAQALANEGGSKLLPSPASAANRLGLTEQVPGKVVFLTGMNSRSVKIGNLEVQLKRTTSRNMQMAGRASGMVAQALRSFRKGQVDQTVVETLRSRLNPDEKRQLAEDQRLAPAWIGGIFARVVADSLAAA